MIHINPTLDLNQNQLWFKLSMVLIWTTLPKSKFQLSCSWFKSNILMFQESTYGKWKTSWFESKPIYDLNHVSHKFLILVIIMFIWINLHLLLVKDIFYACKSHVFRRCAKILIVRDSITKIVNIMTNNKIPQRDKDILKQFHKEPLKPILFIKGERNKNDNEALELK